MARKSTVDVLETISRFRQRVLGHKPTVDQMYDEVRMMKFKVRPLQGDISVVNLHDKNFIEILWSLGKLDEFYHFNVEKISQSELDTFYKMVDEMYDKFQEELNTLDLKQERFPQSASSFEMEIYKDGKQRPN